MTEHPPNDDDHETYDEYLTRQSEELMIIAGKYEVPNRCPESCPDFGKPFDMCSPCFRCPILNCSPVFDEDGNNMTPLAPEDFCEDLAQEWFEFFKELK